MLSAKVLFAYRNPSLSRTHITKSMTSLQERLFAMQDKQYAAFQSKLTPGVPLESFIGIRVPVLRKFAKEFAQEAVCVDFLKQLPHEYYDENILHSILISQVRMYPSDRRFPSFRGQLGCLRHNVSEGICQTQEGAIAEDQDLEQVIPHLHLSLWNRNTYVSFFG